MNKVSYLPVFCGMAIIHLIREKLPYSSIQVFVKPSSKRNFPSEFDPHGSYMLAFHPYFCSSFCSIVITEGSPYQGEAKGRMSFQNFNPAVEVRWRAIF